MPTVKAGQPPQNMMKVMNVVMKTVLRSPLHRLVGDGLMLVTFTGRKSGKKFTTPTSNLHGEDGLIYFSSTAGRWTKNLEGGAPLEIILSGQKRQATAEVIKDPAEVARLLHKFLLKVGNKEAYRLGLEVQGEGTPTLEDVQQGVTNRVVVRVTPR